jgi:membrane-associated phospholipid phosphatase
MGPWRLYLGLLVVTAFLLAARLYATFPGDEALLGWIQSQRHPVLTTFMRVVAEAGRTYFLIGLIGAVTLAAYTSKRREWMFPLATLVLLGAGPILKALADRPRPPIDLVGLTEPLAGNGFPSGHAFGSTLVFGTIIYLASVLIPMRWLRWTVQGTSFALILGVGVSRVYSGAHWPSDVAGAYVIALLVLAAIAGARQFTSALSRRPD